jgi:hypothetical protein
MIVHWVGKAGQMVDDIKSLPQRFTRETVKGYYHAKYEKEMTLQED